QLTDLATKLNIAIDAPHHVRKGQMEPGDADAGRGASAHVNAGRLNHTCMPMSEDEAKAFGIPEEDRRDYIRVDSAKVNITKASPHAKWFHLVSVKLDNPTELYPSGDEVQTVEPWTPPATWADVSPTLANKILDDIDRGTPDGRKYSDHHKADDDRQAWR